MRIGLLGGTFDPIHRGHTEMADTALRYGKLDQVHLVTSVHPPHKSERTHANLLDRHAMVALAAAGRREFIPSSLEFGRDGKSYSVDTLRLLKDSVGTESQILFLIGLDAFQDIATWKDFELLPKLCAFLIFARPGYSEEQLRRRIPSSFSDKLLTVSTHDKLNPPTQFPFILLKDFSNRISSTWIREQIRQGQSVANYLPDGVTEYIEKTRLYQTQ